MIMTLKKCRVHGDIGTDDIVKGGKRKGIQSYRCKKCLSDSHRKHYEKNREKVRKSHDEYRKKDPVKFQEMKNASKRKMYSLEKEKYYDRQRDYVKRFPEKERERKKRHKHRAVRDLDDFYVKQCLVRETMLRHADVPDALVRLKRSMIMLKRKQKEIRMERNVKNKEP